MVNRGYPQNTLAGFQCHIDDIEATITLISKYLAIRYNTTPALLILLVTKVRKKNVHTH